MNPRGAPERVRGGHPDDQSLDLRVNLRATPARVARKPGPVLAKAPPLPVQNGGRGNDHEGLSPPGPDSGEADPEEAISSA